jgi:hypothetical protein
MAQTTMLRPSPPDLAPGTEAFYRDVLETLTRGHVPFLVGGAYAFNCWATVERPTRDLDLFIRRADYERASAVLGAAGHETQLTFPHWLAKVHAGPVYIDLIFSSGNGVSDVDDDWFAHAGVGEVLGVPVKVSPVEEMIWSKAFIMERERFDGADVAHLLRGHAASMDWERLLARFDGHWRVLLSHLVLFGFIYPADRQHVPDWLMVRLLERLVEEQRTPAPADAPCGGTLLSREQYLADVHQEGLADGRVAGGTMSPEDVAHWTKAIPPREEPGG